MLLPFDSWFLLVGHNYRACTTKGRWWSQASWARRPVGETWQAAGVFEVVTGCRKHMTVGSCAVGLVGLNAGQGGVYSEACRSC